MNYKLTDHVLERWQQRRPDKDINVALEYARRDTYHPVTIRAIAAYGNRDEGTYYLSSVEGDVFVIQAAKPNHIVVTVLIPEKVVREIAPSELANMNMTELGFELRKCEARSADVKNILKSIGANRTAIQDRMIEFKRAENQARREAHERKMELQQLNSKKARKKNPPPMPNR